ncbi:vesicle-associated membrane 8 [Brachionus plicatilis]|uniref:Vesicle-associated membrane 8 n=1 Tax=Brachionus plicatilis TaxID=10195 RepID=A0A3M7SN00_BRAPC|nr:vesicle-associated membrane 8 [Brachionus plicatilis]
MSYSYQNNTYRPDMDDVVRQNREQVETVKGIVHQNIEKLYERGERLEELNQKVEVLENSANDFQTTTKKTNRLFMWKNFKWTIIVALTVIILIILVLKEAKINLINEWFLFLKITKGFQIMMAQKVTHTMIMSDFYHKKFNISFGLVHK